MKYTSETIMNKFIKSKIIIPILCILGSIGVSVGTTYALFTSNANTNIAVTSGKVNLVATLGDLDLYTPKLIASDGSSIIDDEDISSGTTFGNGGTATLGTNTLSLSNIAPGDKATFKIHFTNSSNVDIKYRVLYEDITDYEPSDNKLADHLNKYANSEKILGPVLVNWTLVSAGATIPDIEISVDLPIDDFVVQDLSSTLRFSVEAVQANAYTNPYKVVTLDKGSGVSVDVESFNILPGHSFVISYKDETTDTITVDDVTVATVTWDERNGNCYVINSNVKYVTDSEPLIYTVYDDLTVSVQGPTCIAKGTSIMLSNGINKNVEDLTKDDKILAYDLFSGTYVESDILYIVHTYTNSKTYLLEFNNGSTFKIVGEESLFDVDKKEYFAVDFSSADNIIGRRVLACNDGEIDYATIVNVTTNFEEIDAYTVYSNETLNYVANGIVTHYVTGATISNQIYTITDDLKVDVEAFNHDVALYGLASYSDYSQYIEEKYFYGFKCDYANIMFGKGIMTEQQFINGLITANKEINKHASVFLSK